MQVSCFMAEAFLGCAGQVQLPEGYLKQVFKSVHVINGDQYRVIYYYRSPPVALCISQSTNIIIAQYNIPALWFRPAILLMTLVVKLLVRKPFK